MKLYILTSFILLFLFLSSCSKPIKNSHWIGEGKNNDVELIFKNDEGNIIKHYPNEDTDTFEITYIQSNDTIIISRKDEIVSTEEKFILENTKLRGNGIIFIQKDKQ